MVYPRHLLIVNYSMSTRNQLLSHQVDAVNALATYFDEVTVITPEYEDSNLKSNVRVLKYEWNSNRKILSSTKFIIHLLGVCRTNRPSMVFYHMTDFHAAISMPFLKLMRIRSVIWYAHKKNSMYFRISAIFSDKIVTSTLGSCPITGSKVEAIGQAIDSNIFSPRNTRKNFKFDKLIHIGRLDPSKKPDYILEVTHNLREINNRISLTFVGSPGSTKNTQWYSKFQSQCESQKWIKIYSGILRKDIPEFIETFDVFIHAYRGSLDKILLETTMMKVPLITENPEYISIFGSWCGKSNPTLTEEYLSMQSLENHELNTEINRRAELTIKNHSQDGWAFKLSSILCAETNRGNH